MDLITPLSLVYGKLDVIGSSNIIIITCHSLIIGKIKKKHLYHVAALRLSETRWEYYPKKWYSMQLKSCNE